MSVNRKLILFVILSLGSLAVNAQKGTCSDGSKDKCVKPTYNVLFLGSSGSGKSSLINMLYNNFGRVPYQDKWEIVIPLYHKPSSYLVNVPDYLGYKVELKPGGGSQTSEVNKYTVDTGHEIVVFWDTPGFADTAGFERDMKNVDKIVEKIANTSFHAIIVPLSSKDIDRTVGEIEKFPITVAHIRRMLPKSFLINFIGIFNQAAGEGPTRRDGLKDGFLEAFKVPQKGSKPEVYFVDGSGFFIKMDKKASPYDLKLGNFQWEEGDGLVFAEMLQHIRSNTPVLGSKVFEIQQKIKKIEEKVETLIGKITEQQSLETKLEKLRTSFRHEEQRRDENQHYKKQRQVTRLKYQWTHCNFGCTTYDETEKFCNDGETYCGQPKYTQDEKHDCYMGRRYKRRLDLGTCKAIPYQETEHYEDENQRNAYNAALLEITNLTNKKTECKNGITNLKNKREEIVREIKKLQNEWSDLAMAVDFRPMIKRAEKKKKDIEDNKSKSREERDAELEVQRQVIKMYYEMQGQAVLK
ncbi:MAG: hypothetical protein WCK49_02345 [Myxococcaceae bacterium]